LRQRSLGGEGIANRCAAEKSCHRSDGVKKLYVVSHQRLRKAQYGALVGVPWNDFNDRFGVAALQLVIVIVLVPIKFLRALMVVRPLDAI
jgi:hypothetical protein